MLRFSISILFFFVVFGLHGQVHRNLSVKKRTSSSYLPNTVIFKIKPHYSDLLKVHKENVPALNKVFKELDLVSFKKAFPLHESPTLKKNKQGQEMIDLSLIYIITFKSSLNIEEAISKILKTGMVEFAEPKFVDQPLNLPNDPGIQPGAAWGHDQTFYMDRMMAKEAWDVCKGDTTVLIGIVDTGTRMDHEDLKNQIRGGWDYADADNNPDNAGDGHGAFVAGCAAAQTDNGLGIAGTGYNCKFMPIKVAPSAQPHFLIYGYEGIVYAADHNCDVINVSWGGTGSYSQFNQSVINYAVINKNAVVVAAAGNSGLEEDYYPASYDNVLSVGGSDTAYAPSAGKIIDINWSSSTYSHHVDIMAQGTRVYSTYYDTTISSLIYRTLSGTSFSSPLVAGAAGLIKSKFPAYTAQQVMERLRVTADVMDTFPETNTYKEKIGKGRLNMYRALTDNTSPAVRLVEFHSFNNEGEYANAGDTIIMKCKFVNYLNPTNSLAISISSTSPFITFINNTGNLGTILTLDSANNYSNPFKFYVDPNTPINTVITFRIGFSDGTYNDYQYFNMFLSPEFLTIDSNQVDMSIGSNGRFGFNDQNNQEGVGFTYKGNSLLFEGGLMVGLKPDKVSDCVRGLNSVMDQDFATVKSIKFVKPVEIGAAEEARTVIADTSITNEIGLVIEQKSYAWSKAPDDKYIIMEYKIRNISGSTIAELYPGLYADWDIKNSSNNRADYDIPNQLGYVFETSLNSPYAGISLLTNDSAICYSMDHTNVGGNNINPNPNYTTAEKLACLTSGIGRMQAGVSGSGGDVSHVIGGKISNLLNNETRVIAFAILAGDNITDLRASAAAAKSKFKSVKTSPAPVVSSVHLCKNDTANVVITPSNGKKFSYYQFIPVSTPVYEGVSYTINNVTKPDTIYVTSKDSAYESNPVPAYIMYSNSLKADFILAPDTIFLSPSSKVYLTSISQGGTTLSWDLGDGTTDNTESFTHHYTSAGTYKIVLKVTDTYGCEDTLSKPVVVMDPTGLSNLSFDSDEISLYPNPVNEDVLNLNFTLNSIRRISFIIYDLLGKEIYSGKEELIKNKEFQLDLSSQPSGIYFIKFIIDDKPIMRKIIKE